MVVDFAEAYNEKKAIELMFGKIMDGVEKTFKWPNVQLRSVEHSRHYNSREVMKLRFNVFKTTTFEIDVTDLIYSMTFGSSGEKYEIVGEQAGVYLQLNCDGHVPSNVELGEN